MLDIIRIRYPFYVNSNEIEERKKVHTNIVKCLIVFKISGRLDQSENINLISGNVVITLYEHQGVIFGTDENRYVVL